MRRTGAVLILLFAMVAASCGETQSLTAPTPTLTAGGSVQAASTGGKGSPHFVLDSTLCTFNTTNGHMVCNYKVSGLGKYGHAVITLAGLEVVEYTCGIRERTAGRFFIEVDIWGDKSGNYKGTIDAAPVLGPICIFGGLSDVSWALGSEWLLSGLVDTMAGAPVFISYQLQ